VASNVSGWGYSPTYLWSTPPVYFKIRVWKVSSLSSEDSRLRMTPSVLAHSSLERCHTIFMMLNVPVSCLPPRHVWMTGDWQSSGQLANPGLKDQQNDVSFNDVNDSVVKYAVQMLVLYTTFDKPVSEVTLVQCTLFYPVQLQVRLVPRSTFKNYCGSTFLGMYWMPIFKIRLEPDLAGFMNCFENQV